LSTISHTKAGTAALIMATSGAAALNNMSQMIHDFKQIKIVVLLTSRNMVFKT